MRRWIEGVPSGSACCAASKPSIRPRVTPSRLAIAARAPPRRDRNRFEHRRCSASDALNTSARLALSRNCASSVRSISVPSGISNSLLHAVSTLR